MKEWKKVLLRRVTLDVCGVAFFCDVTRKDKIFFLDKQADEEDLIDSKVLCIEVGGRGKPYLYNFDREGATDIHEKLSLILQLMKYQMGQQIKKPPCGTSYELWTVASTCAQCWEHDRWAWIEERRKSLLEGLEIEASLSPEMKRYQNKICLIRYIDIVERKGIETLLYRNKPLLTLNGLFNEMLQKIENPLDQLHWGIEILREVIAQNIHPFGEMPIEKVLQWMTYNS